MGAGGSESYEVVRVALGNGWAIGRAPVDEGHYWVSLEYRVCREFAGMPENQLRYLWCDGFIPEQYVLDDLTPRITGRVWICNGPKQDEWEFTLFLSHPARSRAEIEWTSLLPSENVTRWLALDQHGKRVQIEPSAAVADPA
jgi:hypothetical protein